MWKTGYRAAIHPATERAARAPAVTICVAIKPLSLGNVGGLPRAKMGEPSSPPSYRPGPAKASRYVTLRHRWPLRADGSSMIGHQASR